MGTDLFDLQKARRREAERRIALLGDLVNTEENYDLLRERSRQVLVC